MAGYHFGRSVTKCVWESQNALLGTALENLNRNKDVHVVKEGQWAAKE